VARVEEARTLADGRSQIVVRGTERFTLQRFVAAPHPYHVGEVLPFPDEDEPTAELAPLAADVRERFARAARAARALTDEPARLPPLPDSPALLSFTVAAVIDLALSERQELLATPSPRARLEALDALLSRVLQPLEARAEVHVRAKANGRGPGVEA
jgi:Lon protease-like protein